MIAFDLQNSRVLFNDKCYELNQHNEFLAENGHTYIVYNSTLSTRTHHKVYDYVDKDFKVPAILPKDAAIRLIQYFANVSVHSVTLSTVPVSGTFAETMNALKGELASVGASSLAEGGGGDKDSLDKILSVLGTILNNINLSDCEHGIKAGRPVRIRLHTDNQPIHIIIEQLLEFIYAYTSYLEATIAYHSLNNCTYILYSIMRILFTEHSTFQSDLFTTKMDLILHHFISILIDLITDKCSYELFIKRRHPEAAKLVKKYYTKYPALWRISRKTDMYKVPKHLLEEASAEPVKMLPYLLTYNMHPKDRILYVYESFVSEMAKQTGDQHRWFSNEEFWNILESLTADVKNDRYNAETFVGVLPKLINIIKHHSELDPSVSELLDSTARMI